MFNKFKGLALLALFVAVFAGCGDSRDEFVITNTGGVTPTGAVTFNFVRVQSTIAVPLDTLSLEFTFYDQQNQAGQVTLNTTRDFAPTITITGVPATTRSYSVTARGAGDVPLATITGNVTVQAGQTVVVDAAGATVTPVISTTPLDVFVSNNGPTDGGDLDLFDRLINLVSTFTSGNNQGVAVDALGNVYHNADNSNMSTRVIARAATRGGEAFGGRDRAIDYSEFDVAPGSIKGSALVQDFGLLILADFGGSRLYIAGTAGTDNFEFTNPSTPNPPWDVAYDSTNDRLFVAFTNGSVGVYDDFVESPDGTPDRTISPTGLDNAHGIAYDASTDTLIVSDVGAVTSGPNDDGEIYVIADASTAGGTVTAQAVIGGPNTQLGNPVDIDLQGPDLRVAEKTNDQILVFNQILATAGGDVTPALSTAEEKPESLTSQPQVALGPDSSDVDGGVNIFGIFFSTNPSAANGRLGRVDVDLNGPLNTSFDPDVGMDLESAKPDGQGDVFVTLDDEFIQYGRVANGVRDTFFDSGADELDRIFGNAGSLKGLDLVDSRGLVIAADFGGGEIVVISKYGNTVLNTTTLATDPWDVDYDPGNDRLYVALTDGTVAVFDNYLDGNPDTATPDRIIDVDGGVNIHGIIHDAVNDVLLLSDVGSAGDPNDGQLFVVANASTADGAVAPTVTIGGANTNLGNPVDVAYDGTNLYVAEKSNDLIMRFDGIRSSGGGNIAPDASISVTAPESVSLILVPEATLVVNAP